MPVALLAVFLLVAGTCVAAVPGPGTARAQMQAPQAGRFTAQTTRPSIVDFVAPRRDYVERNRRFTIFTIPGTPENGGVEYVAPGMDNALWLSQYYRGDIVELKPDGHGRTIEVPAPHYTQGITLGPDGNMWYVTYRSTIGRIAKDLSVTTYTDTTRDLGFSAITTGSDGNLWFWSFFTHTMYTATTAGVISALPADTLRLPVINLTLGPDKNVWFLTFDGAPGNGGDLVGFFPPAGKKFEAHVGILNEGWNIISGPGGLMWFPNPQKRSIDTVDPVTHELDVYSAGISGVPQQVIEGPDGNVYFTENGCRCGTGGPISAIGVLHDGIAEEYPTPIPFTILGIAVGSDGNIWFTDRYSNNVGRFAIR
jgi:streptogramin lyase